MLTFPAMRSTGVLLTTFFVCAAARANGQCPPQSTQLQDSAARRGPFEDEIESFEASDKIDPPAKGGIVFVGSSSIRLWPNLATDFPGVNVVQRGFGGSELWQVVNYAPRIVLPYSPARIVLYAGDNDLAAGRSPEQILNDYQNFVALVHRALPTTRIAFVSIKPSGARWALVDKIRRANRLVREYSSSDPTLTYIDVFAPMLRDDGLPRRELFAADSLHLNPIGYALWRNLLESFVYGKPPVAIRARVTELVAALAS
jgi:lysophospholipase L1-like esterase